MPKSWRKPRLPELLAKALRRKRRAEPHGRWMIKTDAKCTNRKAGTLLIGYIFFELNERDRQTFELHVQYCIACAAATHNAFELRHAFKAERCSKP